MSLDKNNTNPGYLLGRLAATLSHFNNLPPRAKGEMAENPQMNFPKYLYLTADDHRCDKEVGEIMAMLPDGYKFPRVLPRPDDGAYWTGFYQQQRVFDKEEIRREVGAKVREAREKAGLTVEELAEKCDLQPAHIGRIEEGRYNLTIDVLGMLSKALETKFEV